ncbi:hotdog fold thioesterase [Persicobacter diffluens]|uniref:Esterase n=1 Tax=Persicobacter diffluens TaxID=981 RepID=A0AAN4VX48_9BACT|nr:esterase [Persicobacter diffluens]
MLNIHQNLEELNARNKGTLMETLSIRYTAIGEDYLCASMPVGPFNHQPAGLLHGGAAVALAETLGSMAATLCINTKTHHCVGLDINANHIRSVRAGMVFGKAKAIHIGRSTHVWEIKIQDEEERLLSIHRLTVAVIEKK